MSIIRGPRPVDGWVVVSNALVRDERISLRAKGLLIQLLSHEPGWRTDSVSLAKVNPEGRDAIRTALKELEAARYLVRAKWQGRDGRWNTDSFVFDAPVPADFDVHALLEDERDPDQLSTADEVDDPLDEHLFDPPSFAQVAPETDSQASVQPAPDQPTPDSQALIEGPLKNSPEVGAPPQDARAKVARPDDRELDEHGRRYATCLHHRHHPDPPNCPQCRAAREGFEAAELRRRAAQRHADAEAVVQADRAAKNLAAAPEVRAAAAEEARRLIAETKRRSEPSQEPQNATADAPAAPAAPSDTAQSL